MNESNLHTSLQYGHFAVGSWFVQASPKVQNHHLAENNHDSVNIFWKWNARTKITYNGLCNIKRSKIVLRTKYSPLKQKACCTLSPTTPRNTPPRRPPPPLPPVSVDGAAAGLHNPAGPEAPSCQSARWDGSATSSSSGGWEGRGPLPGAGRGSWSRVRMGAIRRTQCPRGGSEKGSSGATN